jgi:hypothetical protein
MKCRAIPIGLLSIAAIAGCERQKPDLMTFFVTSVPAGDGGNIGGLAGADAHCQKLADAAGSKGRKWYAYLSAAAERGQPAIHARDRIGKGPWHNSRGVQVAASLEELHGPANQIGRNTALVETAERADFPHDMLTGSNADGTLASGDATCRNWRSTEGQTILGHSDRAGGRGRDSTSWNSAHPSEGCKLAALNATGGSGLYYCFALQ